MDNANKPPPKDPLDALIRRLESVEEQFVSHREAERLERAIDPRVAEAPLACAVCGQPIGDDRLEADPTTTTCERCAK